MQFTWGIHNLVRPANGSVITIGNFDGVHTGHQAILQRVCAIAKEKALKSTVISFEPHPHEVFKPEAAPVRLSNLREKAFYLNQTQLEYFACVKFNQLVIEMRATDFVEQILVNALNVKHVVVGDDFRFGYRREGDYALLKALGKHHGFAVESTKTLMLEDKRISSTEIRTALAEDDFKRAERLLGRPYQMLGRVISGDKKGRELGFPTANIALKRKKVPLHGVYAVRVRGLSLKTPWLLGAANIGQRPTMGGLQLRLEVHILDWAKELYGEFLLVEFVEKIRDEKRFSGLDALKRQISDDVKSARAILNNERAFNG